MWIDLHAHLNFLDKTPKDALDCAYQNAVKKIITIGTCPEDLPVVLELAQKFNPNVFCTLGIHPHDAKEYSDKVERYILDHLGDREVVAVAEIGLDYYYDHSPREIQRRVFRRQLQIAVEHNMPVQIHTRDAEQDTVDILSEFSGRLKGVIHCFTGTQWLADEALKMGLNISISGVVTFKNAHSLREIVKTVPLERIHLETDAPFLAPVPQRGKKNEPAFVVHTAEFVANLKQIPIDILAQQTKKNALEVFPKIDWT